MAIDEEIITNFIATAGRHYTSELPSYLECSICTNVLQDPVCCESGAHTFCRKCLNDWSTRSIRPVCPIDREELGRGEDRPRRAPRALQECIDALEVLCALGCGWTGPQAVWPDHLRRDCPEVEGDDDETRQRRAGSVPLAIRAAREKEEAEARALLAATNADVALVPATNDDDAALLLELVDKRTGAVCDACHADIFDEGYMCVACPDHDICTECWLDGARITHDPTHAFVKLRDRADFFPGEGDTIEAARNSRTGASGRAVHWGITCDGCAMENMAGVRFQCKVCEDFDLCEGCVGQDARRGRHTKDHDMLRISKPKRGG